MTHAKNEIERPRTGAALQRGIGLTGRTAVSWAVAGGILTGGFLVAAMTLAGRLSGNALLLTSGGLFGLGAVLGFLHGGALGFFGREPERTRREALGRLGLAALYAVPALAVGWVVAGWIAMTVVGLYLHKGAALVGIGVAWLVGAGLVVTAGVMGWRSLRHAYARWPDRAVGTVLVTASFAALLVVFLAHRPELWGLRVRVTEVGAVLLAGFASLWLVGPMVTVALRLLRRLPTPQPLVWSMDRRRALTNLALGLAVGVLLGLLALPFYLGPYDLAGSLLHAGPGGAVVLAASRALVDEVLLRLFLVTGVAWLVLRWHNVHREEAAVVAVVVATLVQGLLYLPGVLALGFPSTLATVGYMTVAVLLPALVFGFLYWKRGFGTALVADATVIAALALLAA